ncbi:MAG: D-cysteine desulfhydrase family protein [Firmicutes bacterium]|jgi:D-cysteine desulfhydrase family pyridoxal phosphate-dependent enzyme|nr:D-cysteine desulfhydrase family protein [Bacillota bacterium]
MRIGSIPRTRLASLPTPLEPAPRLGEALGGLRLFVKRDDNTGLAGGGNKARKLEFLMAEAVARGCNTVITSGGIQSNHARMTAAAARKLGMKPVLVLEGRAPGTAKGNLLLDRIFGAQVEFVAEGADLERESARMADEVTGAGGKPYVIPVGGSNPTGCLGYLLAAVELVEQAVQMGIDMDQVFIAAGSGGTMAGLVLGLKVLAPGTVVRGISVSRPADALKCRVSGLAQETARLVGLPVRIEPDEIHVDDSFIGEGYGIPTTDGLDAIRLTAACEGIVLDPVYTGKAMAGLVDYARRGLIGPRETVVFVHTGGTPGVFAFEDRF